MDMLNDVSSTPLFENFTRGDAYKGFGFKGDMG